MVRRCSGCREVKGRTRRKVAQDRGVPSADELGWRFHLLSSGLLMSIIRVYQSYASTYIRMLVPTVVPRSSTVAQRSLFSPLDQVCSVYWSATAVTRTNGERMLLPSALTQQQSMYAQARIASSRLHTHSFVLPATIQWPVALLMYEYTYSRIAEVH